MVIKKGGSAPKVKHNDDIVDLSDDVEGRDDGGASGEVCTRSYSASDTRRGRCGGGGSTGHAWLVGFGVQVCLVADRTAVNPGFVALCCAVLYCTFVMEPAGVQ